MNEFNGYSMGDILYIAMERFVINYILFNKHFTHTDDSLRLRLYSTNNGL